MNKKIIVLALGLLAITARAETEDIILDILSKKMDYSIPANKIHASPKERKEADDFFKKNQNLLSSLGAIEIFYHLDLTKKRYNPKRPGLQDHATYSLYLYGKYYEEYSNKERYIISLNISDFINRGWINKEELDHLNLNRSQKISLEKDISDFDPKKEKERHKLSTETQRHPFRSTSDPTLSGKKVIIGSLIALVALLFFTVKLSK